VPGVIAPTTTTGSGVSNFSKDDYENENVKH